jgi:hypothetical protein
MPTQPWLSSANPLGYLWMRDLFEALDAGVITRDDVAGHVEAGHVRPSLLDQVDRRIEDSLLLPRPVRDADRTFAPSALAGRGPAWRRPARAALSATRRLAERTGWVAVHRRVRDRFVR